MTARLPMFRSDRGSSTVELAIMMPVLLLMLIGIIDIAISINTYVTVTNASREGAAYAIDHPTAAPSAIVAAVTTRSVPLAPERMTVTATYYDGATFQPWPLSGVPASSPNPTYVPVRVEVSYPWSASTILIGTFFSSTSFEARSTMQVRR